MTGSRVTSRVLEEVDASQVERAHFERLTWQEKVMVMMAIKMGYVASVREALDGVRAFRADVRGE